MADKSLSLSYFMRETAKNQPIVEVPGIESIKDEDGNIVPFQVRVLTKKQIEEIYEKYRKRELLLDKKGKPIFNGGQPVFDVQTDSNRALRRLMVEALVYPDLKNKDLMDFFDCPSYDDMPAKVFPNTKEYSQVVDIVLSALGMNDEEEEVDEVEEAKN